jgi:protein phosphatase
VGYTDVGREREVNEDTLYFDDHSGLYMVCDGMGGHSSGQIASQEAVRVIVDSVLDPGLARNREPLVVALERANQHIFGRGQSEPACAGMGTTAVTMRVVDNSAHICHVGDSRAYRLRGSRLQLLTRDHSLSNLYEDKPELAGKLGPATSNVIVRAIGLEPTVLVDHQVVDLEEGDLYLLCCDGLNDLVDDHIIEELLCSDGPLDGIAQALVETANRNGGTDNITVVLTAITSDRGDFRDLQATTIGY